MGHPSKGGKQCHKINSISFHGYQSLDYGSEEKRRRERDRVGKERGREMRMREKEGAEEEEEEEGRMVVDGERGGGRESDGGGRARKGRE